jgi:DNA-binding HxlR family transcriptional regulator
MRSYGQYCAVAKALDVLGDRWTLLIVRELLIAGPSRYTDLRNGLPGIATNLLSDRLRELQKAGIVTREEAPPPVASDLFSLTPRGEAIRPVIHELGLWGIPYMSERPAPGDAFRGRWLAWPAELFLADSDPEGPPVSVELLAEGDPVVLEAGGGEVRVRPGRSEHPDATVSGSPHEILGLLSGQLDTGEARRRGLQIEGDEGVLDRLRPAPA